MVSRKKVKTNPRAQAEALGLRILGPMKFRLKGQSKDTRSWDLNLGDFPPDEEGQWIVIAAASNDATALLACFEATGNRIHLWRAWLALRAGRLPIPEHVLASIDVIAREANAGPKGMKLADRQLEQFQTEWQIYRHELSRIGTGQPSAAKSKRDLIRRFAARSGMEFEAVKIALSRLDKRYKTKRS